MVSETCKALPAPSIPIPLVLVYLFGHLSLTSLFRNANIGHMFTAVLPFVLTLNICQTVNKVEMLFIISMMS